MLKALFKKQFLELNTAYFMNRKTGKRRSKAGITGMIVLYSFVFVLMAGLFFGVGYMLSEALIQQVHQPTLYFALMGLISILMGTFGSVFNTYNGLYKAKDNEMLLSMPIRPRQILLVRMTGVYAMSLLYVALVWVPAVVASWLFGTVTVYSVVGPLLMTLLIALFVTVLTCALGWVVALISTRLKNKGIIATLLFIGFFVLYEYVCMQLNEVVQALIRNAEAIGSGIRSWAWPVWKMSEAAAGDGMALLIFFAITAGMAAICAWIMSVSFTRIVTTSFAGKKKQYRRQSMRQSTVRSALLRRELQHYVSCTIYMMNTGLGIVLMPIGAIIALVNMGTLQGLIMMAGTTLPDVRELIYVGIVLAVCMVQSMGCITAPSVSLEGKNIWIAQTMPVDPWLILEAKERLHILLNIPSALVTLVALGVIAQAPALMIIEMIAVTCLYIWMTADIGLMVNVRRPNLKWTSEAVPVKQDISIMILLFGGWIFCGLVALGCWFTRDFLSGWSYLAVFALVLVGISLPVNRWLRSKGASRFVSL